MTPASKKEKAKQAREAMMQEARDRMTHLGAPPVQEPSSEVLQSEAERIQGLINR